LLSLIISVKLHYTDERTKVCTSPTDETPTILQHVANFVVAYNNSPPTDEHFAKSQHLDTSAARAQYVANNVRVVEFDINKLFNMLYNIQ